MSRIEKQSKRLDNIINIRKRKTQSSLSGSTGFILVRTTGLVESEANVIAKQANSFATVERLR